jgi:radical SAM-linked protein
MMQSNKTLMIRFSIEGGLCYLSQRQTLTMWGRCLARTGVRVLFSEGFNPHPKISLPLPRSVGVEGDEELLRIGFGGDADSVPDVQYRLNQQLPNECRVWKTEVFDKKIGCQPLSVLYVMSPQPSLWDRDLPEKLIRCKEAIASSESCIVSRGGPKHKTERRIDIGAYWQNLEWDGQAIYARCQFTPQGTIRVEELLGRLGLARSDLKRPVLRTKIEWQFQ